MAYAAGQELDFRRAGTRRRRLSRVNWGRVVALLLNAVAWVLILTIIRALTTR